MNFPPIYLEHVVKKPFIMGQSAIFFLHVVKKPIHHGPISDLLFSTRQFTSKRVLITKITKKWCSQIINCSFFKMSNDTVYITTGNSLFMTQHAYAWYKLIYQKPPAKQNQVYWRSYFFDYPSGSKVTARLPPQSHFCRCATMVKLVKLSFLLFKPVKFPLNYSKATSKVRIKIFQFIYQDLKASVFFFCWIFNE